MPHVFPTIQVCLSPCVPAISCYDRYFDRRAGEGRARQVSLSFLSQRQVGASLADDRVANVHRGGQEKATVWLPSPMTVWLAGCIDNFDSVSPGVVYYCTVVTRQNAELSKPGSYVTRSLLSFGNPLISIEVSKEIGGTVLCTPFMHCISSHHLFLVLELLSFVGYCTVLCIHLYRHIQLPLTSTTNCWNSKLPNSLHILVDNNYIQLRNSLHIILVDNCRQLRNSLHMLTSISLAIK